MKVCRASRHQGEGEVCWGEGVPFPGTWPDSYPRPDCLLPSVFKRASLLASGGKKVTFSVAAGFVPLEDGISLCGSDLKSMTVLPQVYAIIPKSETFSLAFFLSLCLCVCAGTLRCTRRPEEGVRSPGLTVGCQYGVGWQGGSWRKVLFKSSKRSKPRCR